MAGFATTAAIRTAIDAGKLLTYDVMKTVQVSNTAGVWSSCWPRDTLPAAGATPATTPGTSYTNAAGSVFFPDRAGESKFLHEISLQYAAGVGFLDAGFMVYDRLVAVSGINLNSTGSKTISSASLPRYTTGEGVSVWLEVTTALNVPVLSMDSYTNDAGATVTTGPTFSPVGAATSMIPIPLVAGDKGVRAVSTLNVTSASTGIVNVVLLKPIAYLAMAKGWWNAGSMVTDVCALTRIYDGASLAFAAMGLGTNANQSFSGHISIIHA